MPKTTTSPFQRDENGNLPGYGLHVPTSNPCPAWCIDEPGHGYDAEENHELGEDYPTRWHAAFREELHTVTPSVHGPHLNEISVDVHTLETVDPATGVVLHTSEPEMWLHADDDLPHLTVGEARALAAMLTAGSDRMEEIALNVDERASMAVDTFSETTGGAK